MMSAEGSRTQMTPDPIAAKVLNRGNALVGPAGRADDFPCPRAGSDALAASEFLPQPVALKPSAPAAAVPRLWGVGGAGSKHRHQRVVRWPALPRSLQESIP
jgi:hypothetical protein